MTSSPRLGSPPNKPNAALSRRSLQRREVCADELASMPDVPIWDVRPFDERLAEPGYIPGSRSVVMGTQDAMSLPWNKIVEGAPFVALVCLSGRRSGNIAAELWAAGQERVLQLRGGVLEWQASRLALCVPLTPEPSDWTTVVSLAEFRREAAACFVAESVLCHESASEDSFVSPKLLVEHVLNRQGALDSCEQALKTLDLLAENARRLGHSVDRLGANLSIMRSVLQRLNERGEFTRT